MPLSESGSRFTVESEISQISISRISVQTRPHKVASRDDQRGPQRFLSEFSKTNTISQRVTSHTAEAGDDGGLALALALHRAGGRRPHFVGARITCVQCDLDHVWSAEVRGASVPQRAARGLAQGSYGEG